MTLPDRGAPSISFITVAFGTGSIMIDSLMSLVASLDSSRVTYEYVVVDNAHPSTGDLSSNTLLLATRGVRVIRSGSNLGFGGGCELGVKHSGGAVIGFVNPDVFYEPGWLEPLLAELERPGSSITAPVLLNPDRTVQEAGQRVWSDGTTSPITEAPASGDVSIVPLRLRGMLAGAPARTRADRWLRSGLLPGLLRGRRLRPTSGRTRRIDSCRRQLSGGPSQGFLNSRHRRAGHHAAASASARSLARFGVCTATATGRGLTRQSSEGGATTRTSSSTVSSSQPTVGLSRSI